MSDDRIRGVFKRPNYAAEPIELVLDSQAIRATLGDRAHPVFGWRTDECELICYAGGDPIANFVRMPDGILVCGTILFLMLDEHGEPESMEPDTAELLAEQLTACSPFPVTEDRTS